MQNEGLVSSERVAAVVVVSGNRWCFLHKTISAILLDNHIVKIIVVDNASMCGESLTKFADATLGRVVVLRQNKNTGSAGGFASGIEYARTVDCDYVYLSDDDMVPESNFIEKYLLIRELFNDRKVVICGHRIDVPQNSLIFNKRTLLKAETDNTFFEVFSIKKLINYFNLLVKNKHRINNNVFVPVVPIKGFVYGGALIPIDAIKKAPLPDKSLFLYGDDIAYSWGVEALGYTCYASCVPVIHDIDMTFPGSHIYGLFDKTTPPFKVYYRIRNMVRISLKYSKQGKFILFLSIFIWIIGLLFAGLIHCGPTVNYFCRVKLIIKAILAGYNNNQKVPAGFPS